jgi:hypothetical protein
VQPSHYDCDGVLYGRTDRVHNRQTQSVSSELLSTLPETILPFARKADLPLGFNPFHAQVKPTIDEVYCARPGFSFSQMSDAYTSTIVLGCGIEIKESGGDIGHEWKIHISWKVDETGETVSSLTIARALTN